MTTLAHRLATLSLLSIALLAPGRPARADLRADLGALDLQAASLRDYLAASDLSAGPLCSRLVEANRAARDLVNGITAVDEGLAAPLTLDAATLDAFERLGATTLSLSREAASLSLDLGALSATVDALTLEEGIVAMLQLSDDIGAMADRIGEMADKILTMADDIGAMADRIIATQALLNQNLALSTQSVLVTQENALALVSVVEDRSYELRIADLLEEGAALAARMQAVALKPWTMSTELAAVAADVRAFLAELQAVRSAVAADAGTSTMAVSPTGIVQLAELTAMLAGLGTALDGYVIAIGGLQAITSAPTLYDSLKSVLQLSADIGVMGNRILEMGDQILAMSGNIGMQADLLLATQGAMSADVAGVQGSILAAQSFAVSLIAARWL